MVFLSQNHRIDCRAFDDTTFDRVGYKACLRREPAIPVTRMRVGRIPIMSGRLMNHSASLFRHDPKGKSSEKGALPLQGLPKNKNRP